MARIEIHAMNDKSDVETEGGAYVEGNVSVGGDFVGRDKITTTISGLARRQTYLLVASVLLVTLLLLIVGYPYTQKILIRTAPPPDPAGLQAIHDSHGLTITAVAASSSWLWIGVQKGEQYFLYKADSTKKSQTTMEPVLPVEARIDQLIVDCQGNLWLLLKDLGTKAYDPATRQMSELLNRQTSDGRLSKSTMYAIATRCLPTTEVEVWLGRQGVYTLRYQDTVTSSLAERLLPVAEDRVYADTKSLTEVRALLHTAQMLWVIDHQGQQLLGLSPDGMTKPQTVTLDDPPWSLGSDPAVGDLWIGADDHLFHMRQGKMKEAILLAPEQSVEHILRASVLAVNGDYIWIGDSCTDDSGLPCCPLANYVIGTDAPRCFGPNLTSVNDLFLDEQHTLWIATDNGLFLFS